MAPARSSSSSPGGGPSTSAVRPGSASAPSLSSLSGARSSSRGGLPSPASVKTVTFAQPLDTVVPSSSPSPAPTSSPASPPPSTRHLPVSSSTRSVPASGKGRRNRSRSVGMMNSRSRRRLRRAGFGNQPNTPVTRSSLRNLSTAFAFLGTHSDPSSNPYGPNQSRRLPDRDEYDRAMLKELDSMESHDVKELVDLPPGANVIGTR